MYMHGNKTLLTCRVAHLVPVSITSLDVIGVARLWFHYYEKDLPKTTYIMIY